MGSIDIIKHLSIVISNAVNKSQQPQEKCSPLAPPPPQKKRLADREGKIPSSLFWLPLSDQSEFDPNPKAKINGGCIAFAKEMLFWKKIVSLQIQFWEKKKLIRLNLLGAESPLGLIHFEKW